MSTPPLTPREFEDLVQAHLDGAAGPGAEEILGTRRNDWVRVLLRRLDETDQSLEDLRHRLSGPERDLVVADFEEERGRIDEVLTALIGPAEPVPKGPEPKAAEATEVTDLPPQLQLSWTPGRIIAWSANRGGATEPHEQLLARLEKAGGATVGWETHQRIRLPEGARVDTVAAPIGTCLGWLVALGTAEPDDSMGASARWLGSVAALAVRLAAQGRMVPTLKKARRPAVEGSLPNGFSSFEVRWVPALINADVLSGLVDSRPGSAGALQNRQDPRAFTMSVLTDLVSAISGEAADRLEVPAPPPDPRSKAEVGEAMLGRLGGEAFVAPGRLGGELGRRLDQWARPVSGPAKVTLVVQLEPPDDVGAWYLSVLAPERRGRARARSRPPWSPRPTPAARRCRTSSSRLERIFPELLRPGARRRGEVDPQPGRGLAPHDRRAARPWPPPDSTSGSRPCPAASPTPALRLTSEDANESVVGAQQLANVRWSAVFDDVELTADDVQRPGRAGQAAGPVTGPAGSSWTRPTWPRPRPRWPSGPTRPSSPAPTCCVTPSGSRARRSGGITLAGDGWAADLLASADDVPDDPDTSPRGSRASSAATRPRRWSGWGSSTAPGSGGCLALDMGLGKTPTMLAHLQPGRQRARVAGHRPAGGRRQLGSRGPQFTPGLDVRVHHGPNRAAPRPLAALAA